MPAPKPKKTIEFPNSDQHVELVVLRKEIRDTVLDLRAVMRKGEDQNILVEFTSVIQPGSFADPGRLPRDSSDGRSRSKRKEECLFAAVSRLIQDYWAVVLPYEGMDVAARITLVKNELTALKEVKRKSLVLCKVDGDDQKGYVLIR